MRINGLKADAPQRVSVQEGKDKKTVSGENSPEIAYKKPVPEAEFELKNRVEIRGKPAQPESKPAFSKASLLSALEKAQTGLTYEPDIVDTLRDAAIPIIEGMRQEAQGIPQAIQRLKPNTLAQPLQEARQIKLLKGQFQTQIQTLATEDPGAFQAILKQAYGDNLSKGELDSLLKQAQAGDFPLPPKIQFLDASDIAGGHAAFSPENGGTLFLNRALLTNPTQLLASFGEEVAHYIDHQFGQGDSPGDEGEIFRLGLQAGGPISASALAKARSDQDMGTIQVNGRAVAVEFDQPETGARAIKTFVKNNFKALGGDDGYLSAADLKAARGNAKFTADQQKIIARLQAYLETLEEYADDEWGDENDGVTLADLDQLIAEAKANPNDTLLRQITGSFVQQDITQPQVKTLVDFFETHFNTLDADKDGFVTAVDLAAARKLPTFKSPDQQRLLQRLETYIVDVEELSNDEVGDEDDGVTLKDIYALAERAKASPKDALVQAVAAIPAVPPAVQTVVDFVETHFDKLDQDGDGHLSEADLLAARKDASFKPHEQKILARLQAYLGDLEELADDETGDENDGITRKDIATYGAQAVNHPDSPLTQGVAGILKVSNAQAKDLLTFFEEQFQTLDGDKDGWVSVSELDTAIAGAANDKDRARLLALRAHIETLEEYANDEVGDEDDGITLKDMHTFVQQSNATPKDADIQTIQNSVIAGAPDFTGLELLDFVRQKFGGVDADKDGYLTAIEISTALKDPTLNAKEKSMLLKVMAYISEFEELSNDEVGDENSGVTRADLAKIIQQGETDTLGDDFKRMSTQGVPREYLISSGHHSPSYVMKANITPAPVLPKPTRVDDYDFRSGEAKADVYTVAFNGHEIDIVIPVPSDPTLPTAQDVLDALNALPNNLRTRVEIVKVDPKTNPDDDDWKDEYKDFSASYMTAGDEGYISIYNTGNAHTVQQMHESMLHEIGHIYSHQEFGTFGWGGWEQAMEDDMVSPSDYATNARGEDFSEALTLYQMTKGTPDYAKYESLYPNRFQWFVDHGF